jgi:hypothetical protein
MDLWTEDSQAKGVGRVLQREDPACVGVEPELWGCSAMEAEGGEVEEKRARSDRACWITVMTSCSPLGSFQHLAEVRQLLLTMGHAINPDLACLRAPKDAWIELCSKHVFCIALTSGACLALGHCPFQI